MRRHIETPLDELPILPPVTGSDGRPHAAHLFAHGSADMIVDRDGDWTVSAIHLRTSQAIFTAGRLSYAFTTVEPGSMLWSLISDAIHRDLTDSVNEQIQSAFSIAAE